MYFKAVTLPRKSLNKDNQLRLTPQPSYTLRGKATKQIVQNRPFKNL